MINGQYVLNNSINNLEGLTKTDGNIIVGNGSAWVAESGATARTSLGLGTGDSVEFSRLVIAGSTTNSSGKFGGFELQSYAVNNSWLGENTYYDGAYKYRANGYAIAMIFGDGALDIRTAGSGLAGNTATLTSKITLSNAGAVDVVGAFTAGTVAADNGADYNGALSGITNITIVKGVITAVS